MPGETPDGLLPVFEVAHAVDRWLSYAALAYAFIGGLAVALRGRARITRDVDAVVRESLDDAGLGVAVSFGFTPFELEAIARAERVQTGTGALLPVILPEHLAVMKALAWRPGDIGDIEGILDRCPGLDLAFITAQLQEIADVLEEPDIPVRFQELVAGWRRGVARRRALLEGDE